MLEVTARKQFSTSPASMAASLAPLQAHFGPRLRRAEPLARYTSARAGGPADALIDVESVEDLASAVEALWGTDLPFTILGGGSNVLVSDAGFRGVVVLNRSRQVRFDAVAEPPVVWAASGANLGRVARQAAARGLSGLEWAAGIPGTFGGAVVGNAGAHGGDMAGNLLMAEILHRESKSMSPVRETWPRERLAFTYRSSALRRQQPAVAEADQRLAQPQAVVLAATLELKRGDGREIQERMEEYLKYRRQTQPPGASMGSMFKNPAGDHAGRLIEAAGLKGKRIGQAEISPLHANFFINHGRASAADIWALIQLARREVAGRFGILLELEIELLGTWN